jgi:hypothetical protein
MPTNINDATYFELRLIEEICRAKNITFNFGQDLSRYKVLLKKSHGASSQTKIEIQEARLKSGLQTFLTRINQEETKLSANLTEVYWVGRKNLGDRVADLDLVFKGNTVLPISAKSGGPGTERNLGGDSLRDLLGYDSTQILNKMKADTIKSLTSNFPNIQFGTSWEEIRKSIKNNPHCETMTLLANAVGKKYQSLISGEVIQAWQNATDKQKLAVVAYLALQNDSRDHGLKIFVAEDDKAYFKDVLDISDLGAHEVSLINHQNSLNGTLEILIRRQRYWRLNVNFTNGLGLSPIAIRVFLI